MNNETIKGGVIGLTVFALMLFSIIGYMMNLVHLIIHHETLSQLALGILGVVIPFFGAIYGWLV